MEIYRDPASGRYYVVDPATGESRWIDEPPRDRTAASPAAGPVVPGPAAAEPSTVPGVGPAAATTASPVPMPVSVQAPVPGPGEAVRDLGTFGAASRPDLARRPRDRAHPRSRGGRAAGIALVGAGVVGVLVIVGSVLHDSGDAAARLSEPATASTVVRTGGATPAASSPAASPVAARAAAGAARIGTPVRDGDLQFTVTGIQLSATLGNKFLSTQAEGRFLLVSLTVRNVGREPRLFLAPSQQLFDAHGQQYSSDSASAKYLSDDDAGVVEQVAPGTTTKGIVVFDIPTGTVLDRVELHESDTSDGVDVKLTR